MGKLEGVGNERNWKLNMKEELEMKGVRMKGVGMKAIGNERNLNERN
jgi:hypothetical protein